MSKKWFLIILLCLLIICIGAFVYNENSNKNNKFQVGSTNFELPKGYVVGSSNEFNGVNITDGKYTIFLVEHNDTNVTKYIKEYENVVKNKNRTMYITNSTVDGILIYKTNNIDSPENVHYWTVKNGKTYEIYKWDENPKMESIVVDLFKTL